MIRFNSILSLIILVSCTLNRSSEDSSSSISTTTAKDTIQTPYRGTADTTSTNTKNKSVQSTKVLVVQCYNGYEFAMGGYDFNPLIEHELKRLPGIEVIPFSLKKLMGVTYQGVYDKKYCRPIIEKIEADYFVMTRFTGSRPDAPHTDFFTWGYETKILNVKTMNQKISIGASGFSDYDEIEKHIKANVQKLVNDIHDLN